jgi:hypothetical protein
MPIAVECACGKRYKVPDDAAGKKFRCKECGEALTVPGAKPAKPAASRDAPARRPSSAPGQPARRPSAGTPARKPAAGAASPDRPKKRPPQSEFDDEFDDYEATPSSRKSAGGAGSSSRPKKRPPQDDYEDFEDDAGKADDFDDDYGPPAKSRSRSSAGALPPRRSVKSAESKRKPPKPDADDKPKKRKKAKSGVPDEDETSPVGLLIWGAIIIAVGIGSYVSLGNLEEEGGSMRTHKLIALIYNLMGRTGVLAVFGGLGLILVIMGIVKLVNRN